MILLFGFAFCYCSTLKIFVNSIYNRKHLPEEPFVKSLKVDLSVFIEYAFFFVIIALRNLHIRLKDDEEDVFKWKSLE